eukprot:COSAG05_NODE_10931_length_538_cov_1.382688_1_plen_77_part_10
MRHAPRFPARLELHNCCVRVKRPLERRTLKRVIHPWLPHDNPGEAEGVPGAERGDGVQLSLEISAVAVSLTKGWLTP